MTKNTDINNEIESAEISERLNQKTHLKKKLRYKKISSDIEKLIKELSEKPTVKLVLINIETAKELLTQLKKPGKKEDKDEIYQILLVFLIENRSTEFIIKNLKILQKKEVILSSKFEEGKRLKLEEMIKNSKEFMSKNEENIKDIYYKIRCHIADIEKIRDRSEIIREQSEIAENQEKRKKNYSILLGLGSISVGILLFMISKKLPENFTEKIIFNFEKIREQDIVTSKISELAVSGTSEVLSVIDTPNIFGEFLEKYIINSWISTNISAQSR